MSAIFTNIYADITPEFQELCTPSFPFPTVIQKVCNMTGAVFVQGRQPKLAGNWQTMKTVHDLLSGLVLYYKVLNEFDVGIGYSPGKIVQPPEQQEELKRTRMHHNTSVSAHRVELRSQTTPDTSSDNTNSTNITTDNELSRYDPSKKRRFHEDDNSEEVHYRNVQVITLAEVESDSDDNRNVSDSVGDIEEDGLQQGSQNAPSNDYEISAAASGNANVAEDNDVAGLNKDTVQGDNTEALTCSECSYTTQCGRNLLHHRVRVHLRPWKCRSCDKGFGLQKDLQRHYKSLRSCRVYKRPQRDPPGRPKPSVQPFYSVINEATESATVTEGDNLNSPKTTTKCLDNSDVQDRNSISSEKHGEQSKEESMEKHVEDSQVSVIKLEPFDYDSSGETSKESCTCDRMASYQDSSTNITDSSYSGATKFIKSEICDAEEADQYGNSPDGGCEKNNIHPSAVLDEGQVGSSSRTITIHPHQILPSSCVSTPASLSMPHSAVTSVDGLQTNFANRGMCADQDINMHWPGDGISIPQSLLASVSLVQPIVGSETAMFLCSSCDYKADTTKKVDDHIHRVHFKRFQCSKCPALFGLQKDLTRHYRKTHKMFIESQRRGRKSNGKWQY